MTMVTPLHLMLFGARRVEAVDGMVNAVMLLQLLVLYENII